MKRPPFVTEYPILLNDISVDAKIRSWTLFNYLQDAASRHADQLGVGLKQLQESSLSWVLCRIRLKMDSFPGYGDTLRITTYPSGFNRLFAFRQFVLSSAVTGERFGVAGSAWLTLNPVNFRPVSPVKFLTGIFHEEFEGDTFFQEASLDKLSAPENPLEDELNLRISAPMIDYNRHLNNAYYAMFTEDWLSEKQRSLVRFNEIQINFNHSSPLGELLKCTGSLDAAGNFYVEGNQAGSGQNAFQAQGVCEKLLLD